MTTKSFPYRPAFLIPALLLLGVVSSPLWIAWAGTVFHIDVGVVVVSFTVKDDHGRYVSGLQPQQVSIREDGVEQQIESFTEAAAPGESAGPDVVASPASWLASSIFILFDTSNSMYEGFARSEDTIADFIRHLDSRQAVAVYSFSQNMTRLAPLTQDHEQAIRGLRNAAAGDATAVLNATLLTVRDAARVPGRKVIVLFSNGPDDASMVAPSDVSRIAEDEGIPIYIVATKAHDQTCQKAFSMLSTVSGGQLFLAGQRPLQAEAFRAIGEDLKHTYTLTYRPLPNENTGWRKIDVQVLGDAAKGYKVVARNGYRPHRPTAD